MKFSFNSAALLVGLAVAMTTMITSSFASPVLVKRGLFDDIDWSIPQNHQFLVGYWNAFTVPGFNLDDFILAHPLVLPEKYKLDPRFAMIAIRFGLDRRGGLN
ncbi:hypothetical protein H4219_005767 [Mycoemilia scoparia]|uniref:Uncharacterized protein n=1 Tax=Mycoemilia scoparia TaxID=417184 RepID=A0A9W8DNS8_9FUNG|nr:hypothetical protein H4219_005767 [Mycoemilia scoparia]